MLYYSLSVRTFYVYIVSNFGRTVLYTGITNNIERRMFEHKSNTSNFTTRYKCHYLMYYETFHNPSTAIAREKQLKKWRREWKIIAIRKDNPDMIDLAKDWFKGLGLP